jgi:hypothetical protein
MQVRATCSGLSSFPSTIPSHLAADAVRHHEKLAGATALSMPRGQEE